MIDRQIDDRAPLAEIPAGRFFRRTSRNIFLREQFPISCQDFLSADPRLYTPPREHLELVNREEFPFAFAAIAGYNRLSQGMLGVRFDAGRVEEQVLLCKMVRKAVDGDDLRFPIGERPRFVKRDLGDGRKPLQSVALAHEKAVFGGIPNRGHDGGGGGQDQGAGTKDHQNGHRPDDLPGDQPGQGGCAEGNHNNPGCPPVCNADNLRFPGVCRLH